MTGVGGRGEGGMRDRATECFGDRVMIAVVTRTVGSQEKQALVQA